MTGDQFRTVENQNHALPVREKEDETLAISGRDETRTDLLLRSKPRAVQLDVAGASHCGRVREHNEDHYFVVQRYRQRTILSTNLPDGALRAHDDMAYVMGVADGLGGHSYGELASRLALTAGWQGGNPRLSWLLDLAERDAQDFPVRFTQCAQELHKNLLREATINPSVKGMATTLTVACTWSNLVMVGHIGDSRAYLLRRGEIERLTHDHTLAEDLIRTGISPASVSRVRHVLTNCLGGDDGQVRVDMRDVRLELGDQLLLCTDGLTDQIADQELLAVVLAASSAAEAVRQLVDLALERGGRDNVTVIVARWAE